MRLMLLLYVLGIFSVLITASPTTNVDTVDFDPPLSPNLDTDQAHSCGYWYMYPGHDAPIPPGALRQNAGCVEPISTFFRRTHVGRGCRCRFWYDEQCRGDPNDNIKGEWSGTDKTWDPMGMRSYVCEE